MIRPTHESLKLITPKISKTPLKGDYLGGTYRSTDEGLAQLSQAIGVPIENLVRGNSKVVGQCCECWQVADYNGVYLGLYIDPNDFKGVAFSHGFCPVCHEKMNQEIAYYKSKR